MATVKKSAKSATSVSGTLLSAPFKPGKDGVVYFYFWVKYIDKLATEGTAKVSPKLLKSQANMLLVDVNGMYKEAFAPFNFELKNGKPKAGRGHFALKWLPPGSTRKQAEAWIKSSEGKAWAGDYATALSTFSIRVF